MYFLSLMRTPIILLFAHAYNMHIVCKLQLDLKVYAFRFIWIEMHIMHEQTKELVYALGTGNI